MGAHVVLRRRRGRRRLRGQAVPTPSPGRRARPGQYTSAARD
jgi:hypothetical protein